MSGQPQRQQVDLITLVLTILHHFWPVSVMIIVAVMLKIAWYWGLLAGLTIWALFFWPAKKQQQSMLQGAQIISRSRRTVEQIMIDIEHNFVGLEPIKIKMCEIIKVVEADQRRKAEGLPPSKQGYHMIFSGNPGTGKTAIARKVAELFAALHLFGPDPRFIETDRAGLVAGYVGQTAQKVHTVVNSALGGVLIIDEAYALTPRRDGQDFAQEAIAALIKRMEDDRDKFCCVLAGYTKQMQEFVNSNPGIESRIAFVLDFPDYDLFELLKIAEIIINQNGYDYDESVLSAIKRHIIISATGVDPYPEELRELTTCRDGIVLPGNARDVRKIIEQGIRSANMADRHRQLLPSDFEIDVASAKKNLEEQKKRKERQSAILPPWMMT